jgi:uncharacterized protein
VRPEDSRRGKNVPDGLSCRVAELDSELGIECKVRFLSNPSSYFEHPTRIETIETHFSWVFLTDRAAYKLKKPVRGEGFDFRTVEARRRNALAELRLNRRLAADVYLGVVPIVLTDAGRLAIGGPGRAVDWLVKMVRLDAGRMLARHLAHRDWRYAEIEALAHRLADFFAKARRASLTPAKWTARLRHELRASVAAFQALNDAGLLQAATRNAHRLDCFLRRRSALFEGRIEGRYLVEGHGDLRPEHVYLNGAPRIIDCLEFRADLRQLDPIDEIAYLTLECRRLRGFDIGPQLLRRYRQRVGDPPPQKLVHFYAALNALVRARIAVLHLAEPGSRTREELVGRAAEYLAIAGKECRFLSR